MYKLYRFNEDRKAFGNQLKKIMKEKGYSVEKLIMVLDENSFPVSENTVKKWRSGDRIPNIDALNTLANVLGVSMQQLYLPGSIFEEPFTEQMELFLGKRLSHDSLLQSTTKEIRRYFEYLSQKMLFSFLSIREKKHMAVLFDCYQITEYGKSKLCLGDETSSESFFSCVLDLIHKEKGKNLPFTVDEETAIKLYSDFEKMIVFRGKSR